MPEQKSNSSLGTLIFVIILVPVIGYLITFSIKKNSEAASRAEACYQQCKGQGYAGHTFQWDILSGPRCDCLGEPK